MTGFLWLSIFCCAVISFIINMTMAKDALISITELPPEIQESLAYRIIPLELRPPSPEEQPESTVEVHITGDAELSDSSGERTVQLHYDTLTINGLLLASDWVNSNELKDFSSVNSSSPHLRRLDDVRDGLAAITGLPKPLEQKGKSSKTSYRLHPSILFIDKRGSEHYLDTLRRSVVGAVPALNEFNPGTLQFTDNTARRNTFASMLRDNVSDPLISRLITESMRHQTEEQPKFDAETLYTLFTTIDKGLAAYLGDKSPTTIKAVGDAIVAYRQIYGTLLPALHRLSRRFDYIIPGLQSEFFQAAAIENLRFLLEFEGHRPDLCQPFYAQAYTIARWSMRRVIASTIRHAKGLRKSDDEATVQIKGIQERLWAELNRTPTTAEIVEELGGELSANDVSFLLQAGSVDGYMASVEMAQQGFSGAGPNKLALSDRNTEANFDLQTEKWFLEEEAQRVFGAESPLSDAEKIALSLYFELFSPALRGSEYRHRYGNRSPRWGELAERNFIYPYTVEDFRTLLRTAAGASNDAISQDSVANLLSADQAHISNLIKRGLAKARVLYLDNAELAFALDIKQDDTL